MYKRPVKSHYIPKSIQTGQVKPINKLPTVATPDAFAVAMGFKQISDLAQQLNGMKEEAQKSLDSMFNEHKKKVDAHLERITEATKSLQRERAIAKGEKGDMPVAGKDFPLPENGKDADPDTVVSLVLKKVKMPKNGETPIKGVHYFDGEDGDPGENPDPADVVQLIKEKKLLKAEHIDGFEQTIEATVEQYNLRKGIRPAYLHGGGDTVKAGSNITLTKNSDGTTTITSSGGSGFTTLAATETPNGSTTVFTFSGAAAQPSFIVSDNVWMRATTKSGTVNWTWNAGLKQATLTVPPQDEIFAVV